jgi:hypothetical protein
MPIDAHLVTHAPAVHADWITPEHNVDGKLDELAARRVESLEAADGAVGIEVTAADIQLPLGTQVTNTDSDIFTLSSSRITINRSGTYMVDIHIGTKGTVGGGAYGIEAWPTLNGSEISNSKLYVCRGDTDEVGYVSVTDNYTVLADNDVVICDATGGAFTVTLPAASDGLQKVYIKKVDSTASAVTIATGSGSDLIDGSSTKVLSSQTNSVTLASNGTNTWHIL